MSSPGMVSQPLLVSGTNIKTINGNALPGSGDLSIGSSVATDAIFDAAGDLIVGTGANTGARLALGTALQVIQVNAGATTVEYVGTSGTGDIARVASPTFTGTLNAAAITVASTITGGSAVLTLDNVSGAQLSYPSGNYVQVNSSDVVSSASGFNVRWGATDNGASLYKQSTYVKFDFNAGIGAIRTSNVAYLSQTFQVQSYNNIELSPGALGGGGTYVEINNGTAGVYRDLKMRDLTAGAITASGSIKPGVKTIATLPSAASSDGERYRCSDSATTTGRLVYSNGTAWYYENGVAV